MNLHIEHAHGLAVVRVGETRLMYPLLSDFSGAVLELISGGERKLLIDLSSVTYVDSATIGCFMDLYRQAAAAGSMLKAKEAGKVRMEGKDYVMRDGDVVEFRFNV